MRHRDPNRRRRPERKPEGRAAVRRARRGVGPDSGSRSAPQESVPPRPRIFAADLCRAPFEKHIVAAGDTEETAVSVGRGSIVPAGACEFRSPACDRPARPRHRVNLRTCVSCNRRGRSLFREGIGGPARADPAGRDRYRRSRKRSLRERNGARFSRTVASTSSGRSPTAGLRSLYSGSLRPARGRDCLRRTRSGSLTNTIWLRVDGFSANSGGFALRHETSAACRSRRDCNW